MPDIVGKIKRFVMKPFNHIFLGLAILSIPSALSVVGFSFGLPFNSDWGWVFVAVGSVWLIIKGN